MSHAIAKLFVGLAAAILPAEPLLVGACAPADSIRQTLRVAPRHACCKAVAACRCCCPTPAGGGCGLRCDCRSRMPTSAPAPTRLQGENPLDIGLLGLASTGLPIFTAAYPLSSADLDCVPTSLDRCSELCRFLI
jgi:hypothetical protein